MRVRLLKLLCLTLFSCATNQTIETHFELFKNKNVVILGGTGYLGRALTTEILKYEPNYILIYSRDEVKHFHFMQRFNHHQKLKCVIGDIRDYDSILKATKSADIVIHAAALKRMDMLEYNVEESIKTNTLGSINVFNACIENSVKKVVFVSTDKACSPANTYGACKFISEKLFTNYDKQIISTQFMVARYGNVLESTGSLIPIVVDRIRRGQDILLTNPKMTRFIIDKHEAIELIFDSLRYGTGGEIFVKKLSAFKIGHVVDSLKETFEASNKITVVGIRPGEKMHETLINEDEQPRTVTMGNYFVIMPTTALPSHETEERQFPGSRRVEKEPMKKFSSDQTVLSKKEVMQILKGLDLVKSGKDKSLNL